MDFFVFSQQVPYSHFCNVLNQLRLPLIQLPMFKYLLVLSLLIPSGFVAGQGWERLFDAGGSGQINDVVRTSDGGFASISYYNGLNRARLLKTDADGQLQWIQDYFLGTNTNGTAIAVTADGGFVISGFQQDFGGPRKAFLLKTDPQGKTIWTYILPGNGRDAEGLDVVQLPNEGSYIVCGFEKTQDTSEDVLAFKVDQSGNLVWKNTFGAAGIQEKGLGIDVDLNGNVLIAGEKRDGPSDFYIINVISADGSANWENTYGLGSAINDVCRDIVVDSDGDFVVVGQTTLTQPASGIIFKIDGATRSIIWQTSFANADLWAVSKSFDGGYFVTGNRPTSDLQEELLIGKISADGDKLCSVVVGRPGYDRGYAVVATPDGGALAAGTGEFFLPNQVPEESLYMVKMDKNCRVFTSYISGHVFHDFNNNCTREGNEPGLEDWIVKIESPNFTRFAAANTKGDFLLAVDTGTYNIQLFPPNNAWQSCSAVMTLSVSAFSDTFDLNIPVKAINACPRNEIDIATPVLRRCTNNQYIVRYCNSGTIPSVNTQIVITLDPELTLTQSSISNVAGPNNTYIFDIGFLENGDCGSFTFDAFLDCDAILNSAHCAQAHIYPDSFCNITGWDGSIVEARAVCDGDSIRLALANVGNSDMAESVGFVIVEDIILLTAPGDPMYRRQLNSNEESVVWTTPANGKTYRVIAEQTPGYPGTSYPTAAVERCLSDTSGSFSIGYYTMFPEDEAEPFKSVDCQETYDTDFNPQQLKRGHPKGYDVAHYVAPQTDLEFLIQFQNSGTDTVHQVIVRDTLSTFLDPSTVHPGAASHSYDFDIYGPGIVQFTLPNLNLLPGSGAGSEGFVSFRVSQKTQVPCNSEILNSAAIYLDFNAPVLTNQTYHTVCEFDTFVVVQTKNIEYAGANVKVYPNPFDESAQFEVTGVSATGFSLALYDLQGKQVFNQVYNHPSFRLYRHQLPAGMFFYRLITNKGQPVASGKLLVK